jgi:UDP-glucose 4-epimerase
LLELTGCNQPIKYAPRNQATLVRNRIGSKDRAAREIGFEAVVPLQKGLADFIAWRCARISEVEARQRVTAE